MYWLRCQLLNWALAFFLNFLETQMFKSCSYCNRQFKPLNSAQKYCCKSCKNCSHSSSRLDQKDTRKLLTVSSYYATDGGRQEVERGSHDATLLHHGMTRDEWLDKWKETNSFRLPKS